MKTDVQSYLHPEATRDCRICSVSNLKDAIQIGWTDGHESLFHHVWLRDSCYCPSCGDSYSSKRYFFPGDMPETLDVQTSAISEAGELLVTWSPDGHQSCYDPLWLRQHCYDDLSRRSRKHQPSTWDASMERNLPSADFRQIQGDDVKHLECLRAIRDYGFVIIEGAPAEPGFIRDLAAIVGNVGAGSAYGEIFDLTPSSSVRTMGNTFRPVPPHTDEAFRHAPPGLNILGCLRPASAGGESILVDGFHVGEMLRQEDADGFRLLSGLPHGYHRRHDGKIDQVSRGTIFSLDEDGRMAGVRIHTRASAPLDLPAALVPDYYRAYRRLCQLLVLRPNQMRHTLGAGDAIVFDNHRVLHARGEFDDPRRHLQICNVTRDSFHERLRLVALRLGYSEEAALRLGGGATTM